MVPVTVGRAIDDVAQYWADGSADAADVATGLILLLRARGVEVLTDGTRVGVRPAGSLDDDERDVAHGCSLFLVRIIAAESRCRSEGRPFADPAIPDPALKTYWRFFGDARTHELRPGQPLPWCAQQWCQPGRREWVTTWAGAAALAVTGPGKTYTVDR